MEAALWAAKPATPVTLPIRSGANARTRWRFSPARSRAARERRHPIARECVRRMHARKQTGWSVGKPAERIVWQLDAMLRHTAETKTRFEHPLREDGAFGRPHWGPSRAAHRESVVEAVALGRRRLGRAPACRVTINQTRSKSGGRAVANAFARVTRRAAHGRRARDPIDFVSRRSISESATSARARVEIGDRVQDLGCVAHDRERVRNQGRAARGALVDPLEQPDRARARCLA